MFCWKLSCDYSVVSVPAPHCLTCGSTHATCRKPVRSDNTQSMLQEQVAKSQAQMETKNTVVKKYFPFTSSKWSVPGLANVLFVLYKHASAWLCEPWKWWSMIFMRRAAPARAHMMDVGMPSGWAHVTQADMLSGTASKSLSVSKGEHCRCSLLM